MPTVGTVVWGDPGVTPARGRTRGRTLCPPRHPLWTPPPRCRQHGTRAQSRRQEAGGSSWPPPSPLTAGSLAAHAVMWQGTTTTRTNWLMRFQNMICNYNSPESIQ